ncbi:hypothetical protein N0V93_005179 [Gnomoniopsis smithogilvyi]|uniref:Uncharacterized protein n=1 Tax=Gnomoniopsis smithogilvyi TaxID=1191159 RepID=A0A9W8YU05_9PEZI|nr:hypothetical protein N0V93_005179 [Gnomoniopsis smithogilvyi]
MSEFDNDNDVVDAVAAGRQRLKMKSEFESDDDAFDAVAAGRQCQRDEEDEDYRLVHPQRRALLQRYRSAAPASPAGPRPGPSSVAAAPTASTTAAAGLAPVHPQRRTSQDIPRVSKGSPRCSVGS